MTRRTVTLEIDGQPVEVDEGETILDACRKLGIDTPTLCYGDTLRPDNACRVCVVELEGARTLAPACSRRVEDGMEIKTDSERVDHSRRMVLEFLASSVDLSTAPAAQEYVDRYGADPERYGPPAPPDLDRDHKRTGHHDEPGRPDRRHRARAGQGRQRALRARLLEVHPLLQVRRTPAASSTRTRSPSTSPAAASTRASRPSTSSSCPSPPASTAATASRSARPAR